MRLFPELEVEAIRGNVETRIAKTKAGLYAGIILAAAGLGRLGRDSEITSRFSVDEMVPAAGQGIIAIQTMAGNGFAIAAARSINHAPSEVAARCERGVLQRFGSQLDCYSPVAVHATTEGRDITMHAFFSDYEATRSIRVTRNGSDPETLIEAVYDELVANGAEGLLDARR
jgi:hydroxymethylbilane synthase